MDLTPMYEALSQEGGDDYLAANPQMLSIQVAEAAREDAKQAASVGRIDIVFLASSAACEIYLQLGDLLSALGSRVDALQAVFMAADGASEYDSAREQSLELNNMARQIPAPQISFRALVLAADCSWFKASADLDEVAPANRDVHLVPVLGDVSAALKAAAPFTDDPEQHIWQERLASILAVSADAAMSHWTPDDGELAAVLREVAAATDALPLDLAFDAEGTVKASNVAVVLARLDNNYGLDG